MKNIPRDIWLHIGENTPEDADFNEIYEVTWCNKQQEYNAIHYVNSDLLLEKIDRIASLAEYSEDDSCDMVSVFVQIEEIKSILKGVLVCKD